MDSNWMWEMLIKATQNRTIGIWCDFLAGLGGSELKSYMRPCGSAAECRDACQNGRWFDRIPTIFNLYSVQCDATQTVYGMLPAAGRSVWMRARTDRRRRMASEFIMRTANAELVWHREYTRVRDKIKLGTWPTYHLNCGGIGQVLNICTVVEARCKRSEWDYLEFGRSFFFLFNLLHGIPTFVWFGIFSALNFEGTAFIL